MITKSDIVRVMMIVLALAGCSQTPPVTDGPAPPPTEQATLTVENQSTAQMRIFAVASNQQVRIGTVNGLGNERIRIPAYLVAGGQTLRFMAVPISGMGSASTSEMYVAPGDAIRLVVPSQVR